MDDQTAKFGTAITNKIELKSPYLTAEVAEVARGGERRVVEGGPAQNPHHARIHHVLPAQYLEYRRLAFQRTKAAAASESKPNRRQRKKTEEIRYDSGDKGRLTCAVGADEEASLAGVEGEADVLDERRRAGRRAAVDARVGEGEVVDLNRWRHWNGWLGPPSPRSGHRRTRSSVWLVERWKTQKSPSGPSSWCGSWAAVGG